MPVYGNINPDGTQKIEGGTRRNHTGRDCVRIRSSRAAPVCLLLLCFLLLTAVVVLSVYIHTKSTNYTEETHQLLPNRTEESDQLLSIITNLTEERDWLKLNNKNLTDERDRLLNKVITLTNKRDGLTKSNDQTKERDQFNQERNQLWKMLNEMDGHIYQSSFYYMSSEEKNWEESRRYCRERGTDLFIINNKEEQEFVKKMLSVGTGVWIGLTDSDVEGTWKWVDGRTLTSGSWMFTEPNGKENENCAVLFSSGWYDYTCNSAFKWICVKNIKNYS